MISNGDFNGTTSWTASGNVVISTHAVFNSNNTTPNAVVDQTITTIASDSYQLTFDVSIIGGGSGMVAVQVDIIDTATSNVLATTTISKTNAAGLTHEILDFTTTGTSAIIRFTDVSTATNSLDITVDNVGVVLNAVHGEDVEFWLDQSGNTNDATAVEAGNSPTFVNSGSRLINFNPTVEFSTPNSGATNSTKDFLNITDISNVRGAYWVAVNDDFTLSNKHFLYGKDGGNDATSFHGGKNGAVNGGGVPGVYQKNGGTATNSTTWTGTVDMFSVETTGNEVVANLGGDQAAFPDRSWDGWIAEVILYSSSATASERQRIESYLALKYGITLDQTTAQDYIASNGTTKMWDKDAANASTYNNDITGIGRDDLSALGQAQSRSINSDPIVTITAEGEGINGANTFTDIVDLEFLTWANNDGSTSAASLEAPPGMRERLTREWLVHEIGEVGEVSIAFDLDNQTALANTGIASDYRLLIDADGDFSNATISTAVASFNGNEISFSGLDLDQGQFFTLANINQFPTLTSFTTFVDTTNEDTEVEITFADLLAQGDEADVDGSVTEFEVRAVSTGTLTIGSSSGTATAFATGTNDRINTTLKAYWTPDLNVTGTINAFTTVAVDDDSAESTSAIQVGVNVTAENDPPVAIENRLTAIEDEYFIFSVADFLFTDVEGDALQSVIITALTLNGGSLSHSGNVMIVNGMSLSKPQLASMIYSPPHDKNGLAFASFDFTVNDANTGLIAATMTIDVKELSEIINNARNDHIIYSTGEEDNTQFSSYVSASISRVQTSYSLPIHLSLLTINSHEGSFSNTHGTDNLRVFRTIFDTTSDLEKNKLKALKVSEIKKLDIYDHDLIKPEERAFILKSLHMNEDLLKGIHPDAPAEKNDQEEDKSLEDDQGMYKADELLLQEILSSVKLSEKSPIITQDDLDHLSSLGDTLKGEFKCLV